MAEENVTTGETTATPVTPDQPKKKHIVREYAESIVVAIILALIIRTFIVQAFKIPSGSMEDTLLIGDHLLVTKFLYGTKIPFTDTKVLKFRDPRQGDVVVFEYPEDPSKDFIKRVVGVPGDVVEGREKQVFVNGVQVLKDGEHTGAKPGRALWGPGKVR